MDQLGVAHGRFQIFHNDHLAYLLAAKARCRRLMVGISNPDTTAIRFDAADPKRSQAGANPFPYYQRMEMVTAALAEAGVPQDGFEVVPFPINRPELLSNYVPLSAAFYLTIYDDWGRRKLQTFQELGCRTEILWDRPLSEKVISGTEIRRRILAGEPWQHLVPPAVYRYVFDNGLADRLRELAE